jgi:hypothetical protein
MIQHLSALDLGGIAARGGQSRDQCRCFLNTRPGGNRGPSRARCHTEDPQFGSFVCTGHGRNCCPQARPGHFCVGVGGADLSPRPSVVVTASVRHGLAIRCRLRIRDARSVNVRPVPRSLHRMSNPRNSSLSRPPYPSDRKLLRQIQTAAGMHRHRRN